jgi:hypothetical protein
MIKRFSADILANVYDNSKIRNILIHVFVSLCVLYDFGTTIDMPS